MLAAGLLEIRRLPGVLRPAIAVPIPARDGPSVLLDCGANADARPEHLLQFAHMGAIFAEEILGVARPRGAAALDRRGGGEGQPADAGGARAAGGERRSTSRATPRAATCSRRRRDVVVTDGFTGNVALKTIEGTIRTVIEGLRDEITRTARGKLGGLLIRPAVRGVCASRLDPDTYGGAYLLGLRGLAVIAHGNSSRHGDRERDPPRCPRRRARRHGRLAARLPRKAETPADVCMIGRASTADRPRKKR